jgi:hypothetical protein
MNQDSEKHVTSPRLIEVRSFRMPPEGDAPRPVGIVAEAEEVLPQGEAAPVGLDIKTPKINLCSSTAITFNGGAIGTADAVQLLYWGPIWQTLLDQSNPGQLLQNTFTAAVQSILAGPWIAGLRQYGIRPCPFGGSHIITSPNPPFAPNTFTGDNVSGIVNSLISQGSFPAPDDPGGRNLYIVLMPPNTQYNTGGGPTARGAHSSAWTGSIIDPDNEWYAWVGNNSLSQMTSTFCHELAEMCTDPEPFNGWSINNAPVGCEEIGDLCNNVNTQLNGVTVESYWSSFDNACLVPTAFSLRRALIWAIQTSGLLPTVAKTLGGQGLRSIQSPIPSLLQFIKNL